MDGLMRGKPQKTAFIFYTREHQKQFNKYKQVYVYVYILMLAINKLG